MKLAVKGMMPRNIITKDSLSRLHSIAAPSTPRRPEA